MAVELYASAKSPRSSAFLVRLNARQRSQPTSDLLYCPSSASHPGPLPAACCQTNVRACLRALLSEAPCVRIFRVAPARADLAPVFLCLRVLLLHVVFAALHRRSRFPTERR